jgi:putative heme iron utilization protein
MTEETSSNQELARSLLAAGRSAALATLRPDGGPFASYVSTAPAADGSPLMLLSRLAEHTKNLDRDARASLLFVREPAPGAETMTAARLTLTGRCARDENPEARRLFLQHNPDAARYADFADFSLFRFDITAGHLVAGFGRIVALTREELLDVRVGG